MSRYNAQKSSTSISLSMKSSFTISTMIRPATTSVKNTISYSIFSNPKTQSYVFMGLGVLCFILVASLIYQFRIYSLRKRAPVQKPANLPSKLTRQAQPKPRKSADIIGGITEDLYKDIHHEKYSNSANYSQSRPRVHDDTLAGTTYINNDVELALPGFKEYNMETDITLDKMIRTGGSGDVYLATAKSSSLDTYGTTIIVKILRPMEGNGSKYGIEEKISFHQEISLMHFYSDYTNFVKFLGYSETPQLSIAMKYYKLKSLAEWIASKAAPKSKTIILSFCCDISFAIFHMHTRKIAHCDLKPENILIDRDQEKRLFCVITDFGVSRILGNDLLQVKRFRKSAVVGGSLLYAAPEVIRVLRRLRNTNVGTDDPAEELRKILSGDLYSLGLVIRDIQTRSMSWQ